MEIFDGKTMQAVLEKHNIEDPKSFFRSLPEYARVFGLKLTYFAQDGGHAFRLCGENMESMNGTEDDKNKRVFWAGDDPDVMSNKLYTLIAKTGGLTA